MSIVEATVVVTGGAGFIGSCLVRQLVGRRDCRVVTLDKLTYAGNLDSLTDVIDEPNHVFVKADICDAAAVREVFDKYQPQAIYHLAAESHVDRSIDGPMAFLQSNVIGTFTLLQESLDYWSSLDGNAQKYFRFLHVSTDEVYGSLDADGLFTEHSAYDPRSPYSASKAASDHFVRAYHHTYGLPILVSNSSNNYGPYQFPEKLIPLMILNALVGKPLPLYGDGSHVRDWLYVDDHCRALQLVMQQGKVGETYNIGSNCQRTNLELVQALCTVIDTLRPDLPHLPTHELITSVADRPGHDQRYAIDATKIRTELGWQPEHDFETCLSQTVKWYLDHPDWVQRVTSGVYQGERLGLLPKDQSG